MCCAVSVPNPVVGIKRFTFVVMNLAVGSAEVFSVLVKNLFTVALVMAPVSAASGADVASAYIYDYYDSGVTPKEYMKNYKGKPYGSVPKVGKSSSTKIQAEDFDKGQSGDAYI